MKPVLTWSMLESHLREIDAVSQIDLDNNGQVIVYTGLMLASNDETGERLVPFELGE